MESVLSQSLYPLGSYQLPPLNVKASSTWREGVRSQVQHPIQGSSLWDPLEGKEQICHGQGVGAVTLDFSLLGS